MAKILNCKCLIYFHVVITVKINVGVLLLLANTQCISVTGIEAASQGIVFRAMLFVHLRSLEQFSFPLIENALS